jgi:acyl-ACP thioesterase
VDKFLANMPVTEDRRATEADPGKLPEIGTVNGEETTDSFPVRDSDIDVNEHVNNARYIGWLVDSYPQERHRQQQVRTCEINYLGETRSAEKLLVRTKPVSSVEYLHAMFNADNLEVCRGRLTWEAANSG